MGDPENLDCYLTDLPTGVLFYLLQKLSIWDICSVSRTCRRLADIAGIGLAIGDTHSSFAAATWHG
jgi:hypothetical protein